MSLFVYVLRWIKEICNEEVRMEPRSLEFTSDDLKKQEIWNKAVCNNPYKLGYVPDHFKTGNVQ